MIQTKEELLKGVEGIEISLVAELENGKGSKVTLGHEGLFDIFDVNFLTSYLRSLKEKRNEND